MAVSHRQMRITFGVNANHFWSIANHFSNGFAKRPCFGSLPLFNKIFLFYANFICGVQKANNASQLRITWLKWIAIATRLPKKGESLRFLNLALYIYVYM